MGHPYKFSSTTTTVMFYLMYKIYSRRPFLYEHKDKIFNDVAPSLNLEKSTKQHLYHSKEKTQIIFPQIMLLRLFQKL